jgi:hypothetical protein
VTTFTLKPIGGTVMRLTKVDRCGTVLTGVGSCKVITDGFVMVERNAEYADPDQFIVKNAAGNVCIKHRTKPSFLWYVYNITFCGVDPDAYSLVTGNTTVLDDTPITPNVIGYNTDSDLMGTSFYALEIWSPLTQEPCDSSGNAPFAYWISPHIGQGTVGSPLTIENGPVTFTVSGSRTFGGGKWGIGPYNVQYNNLAVPSKLFTAMGANQHDRFFRTTLAPPTPVAGCQTVP